MATSLALFQPQSVETLITKLSTKFPRWAPTIAGLVTDEIEAWIAELCQFRPIWFLDYWPRQPLSFPLTLPLATISTAPYWVQTSYLQIVQGISKYQIYAPLQDDSETNPAFWTPVRVSNIYNVAYQRPLGDYCASLRQTTDMSRVRQNMIVQSMPTNYQLHCYENDSWIEFFPVPDRTYMMQVSFALEACMNYQFQTGTNMGSPVYQTFNRFLSYAPQIVLYYCMAKVAEWYDESKMQERFLQWLFGIGLQPGQKESALTVGAVGMLRKKSLEKSRTMQNLLERYSSARTAFNSMDPDSFGNNGYGIGGPYGSFGFYPWNYG